MLLSVNFSHDVMAREVYYQTVALRIVYSAFFEDLVCCLVTLEAYGFLVASEIGVRI
jgi:hypothetical protein